VVKCVDNCIVNVIVNAIKNAIADNMIAGKRIKNFYTWPIIISGSVINQGPEYIILDIAHWVLVVN